MGQNRTYCISLGKEERDCTRGALSHNLPIIRATCIAHTDSQGRPCGIYVTCIPDEYRVMGGSWRELPEKFLSWISVHANARTRVIAREIGCCWVSFNPEMAGWKQISRSLRRENSLREILTSHVPFCTYVLHALCLWCDNILIEKRRSIKQYCYSFLDIFNYMTLALIN